MSPRRIDQLIKRCRLVLPFNTDIGMSKGTFRGLTLVCLLVNAAVGSPRFHSAYEHRNPRHASCASCRRERPDALVSWVSPPRTEYHDLEFESRPWQDERFFRASRSSQPPHGGGGTTLVNGPERTSKRENSFAFEGDVDSDVAPPQATASHGMAGVVTGQSKDPSSISYGKPNLLDVVKSQAKSQASNRYNVYGRTDKEPRFLRFLTPLNSPGRHFIISHGADTIARGLLEEEVPAQHEQSPGMQFLRIEESSPIENQKKNYFYQYQGGQVEEPLVGHDLEMKRNLYNGPFNLNGYKKMYQIKKVQMKDLEREKFGGYIASEMDNKGGEMNDEVVKRMNEEMKKIVQVKPTSQIVKRITRSFPVVMQVPRKVTSVP